MVTWAWLSDKAVEEKEEEEARRVICEGRVERLSEYEQYFASLLVDTHPDHPDRQHLATHHDRLTQWLLNIEEVHRRSVSEFGRCHPAHSQRAARSTWFRPPRPAATPASFALRCDGSFGTQGWKRKGDAPVTEVAEATVDKAQGQGGSWGKRLGLEAGEKKD
ncbi:hypothetical protein E2C01_004021 [Portunus trituberculatus]|uniref:Uncharacterized protein n=1 Tax=Portunus trituberculatus TaxID=210409 RepID=A0A5B7CPI8_PORTR|nr:hypothetical protein [Portunus trituberculatus]